MKKILCPTDFSEAADQAVAYAAALCKRIGAELTLLHVQSVFSFASDEMIKGHYSVTEESRDQLDQMAAEVKKMFGISCVAEVEPANNSLNDVIAKRALEFDLIVMGTNGADDYYAFFFGSHSYQLAIASAIPVLLIPKGCAYQDISSIVFAFDYEHEHELPLKQLSEFSSLLEASVMVMQVKSHYRREEELNSEQIQTRTRMLYNMMDIEFITIYSDEVEEGINAYMTKNNVDVLALCSLQYTMIKTIFHKSLIKLLTSTATYPVFVFHK